MKPCLSPSTDRPYHSFLDRTEEHFTKQLLALGTNAVLFEAAVPNLWDRYLHAIPERIRQSWNCNACRHFIQKYGAIVSVRDNGTLHSLVWDESHANPELSDAVELMRSIIEAAKVESVFVSDVAALGDRSSNGFRHLSAHLPSRFVFTSKIQLPNQYVAEKTEDFRILSTALADFSIATLDDAIRVLESDSVHRAAKFVEHAKWLRELKHHDTNRNHTARHNFRWLAVGTAPAGWCHPRGAMIGTLLGDIAAGLGFTEVKNRWDAKMHPLVYQRPQVAPAAGAIAQAEKLVAQLGIERSLARRFATIEDVQATWKPSPSDQVSGGVFGALKARGEVAKLQIRRAGVMTFEKFNREVLPRTTEMELYVPGSGDFVALLTAQHADAPPILQWDRLDRRNPVSWYRYYNGAVAQRFSLTPGTWCKVRAICYLPPAWYGAKSEAPGVLFLLHGAKDAMPSGLALFPEILRSELHGVRSVIESYSKLNKLGEVPDPACGLCLGGGTTVQVRCGGVEYVLDRID